MKQNINHESKNGTTALLKACHLQKHAEACHIVRLLASYGADVDHRDNIQLSSALHIAVMRDNLELLILLKIELKADTNLRDRDEVTPLFLAAERGNKDMIYILFNRDVLEMARKSDKMTPLLIASERGHSEVVERLLPQALI